MRVPSELMRVPSEILSFHRPGAAVLAVAAQDVLSPRCLTDALAWIAPGRAPLPDELVLAQAAVDGSVVLVRPAPVASMPELPASSVPWLADHRAA